MESDLPSYKTYELLSNENGNSGNFSDECYSLQRMFSSYDKIFGLCKKLAGNLVNFCSSNENRSLLNYNCEFIHQWLFNEIINNLSLPENGARNGVKGKFYNTWQNILNMIGCKNKCDPNRNLFKSSTIDVLKFRKDMHDYMYNYENFDKITTKEKICNTFSTYLSNMHTKYDHFKSSCPVSTNKCLLDAKSLEDYNPEKLCKKFHCTDEALCAKYIGEKPAQNDPGRARPLEGEGSPDNRYGEDVASVDESETSAILTTVGLSLLGLLIISFISFKFTPIRSWLNKRIINRRNIEEYLVEDGNNEVLNDYFNLENRESVKIGYSVA